MEQSDNHICHCLSRILTSRGHATITISRDRHMTGEEFVGGVLGLARGLVELGVGRGDVVAIAALNSEWYMEWLLAVAYVGGIAAPLNYRWSVEEARTAMEVVRPVMLVVDESCSRWTSSQHTPSLKFRVLMEEFPSIISRNGRDAFEIKSRRPPKELSRFSYQWAPKNIALICFTSGTTGRPKGVAISHTSLIVQAFAKISIVGYCENDVYLHTAPLCHIGGLSSCIAILLAGGCHIFIPKFDAKEAIQVIEQSQVTTFIVVPTMIADLITYTWQWNRRSCGESVKRILNGGGGLTTELITSATRLFPRAKLISAYGMTEACSSLTFMTLHDPTSRNLGHATESCIESSTKLMRHRQLGGLRVGKPPAHIELWIDMKDGVGRIMTRGPHVMVGYWEVASSTSSKEPSCEWLDTGDVGWMDPAGNLWLLGRTKNRIKSGGENIYPEEVESVLLQHPGVSNAVVVGIPDYRLTEMVVACVNLKRGWEWNDCENSCSPDSSDISGVILRNFCRKRNLTSFKIPKHFIYWREPFPRTSTGKVKRDPVRSEAMNYPQFLQSNL